MVGGVLVVALRLVGRVSAMFHPVPSLYNESIRTGDVDAVELRRALISLAQRAIEAEEGVKAMTFSIEEQVAAGVRLRVVAREAGGTVIWKIADTDGAVLPGSWPTPEEATRTARAAEAIMRDVEV